ncbi:thioredoxin-like superfamily [Holotrichia oblita]|uniref:Thioredoxin-like superfamily n=1 Tax=Holotrichia oblita TaxID=644536 RepID=A0ACB9TEA8_HOLOL|nr:thioredoxin-like superfamily [Holotrichia oblita]
MVVKIYVKKRQQRVLMILDSRIIKYDVVDIAEPGNEEHKDFMQNNSTSLGATDYDQFDMANEIDELEKFLKLAPDDTVPLVTSSAEIKFENGNVEANVKENDTGNEEETEKTSGSVLENTIIEKEQSPQIEPESIEKTNGETKIENGDGNNESVAVEES